MPDLLQCPFCGSDPVLKHGYWIECSICGAGVSAPKTDISTRGVCERWNARAHIPVPAQPTGLREAAEAVIKVWQEAPVGVSFGSFMERALGKIDAALAAQPPAAPVEQKLGSSDRLGPHYDGTRSLTSSSMEARLHEPDTLGSAHPRSSAATRGDDDCQKCGCALNGEAAHIKVVDETWCHTCADAGDLIERLRNPMWAHSTAPFLGPQLEQEENLAAMNEAAAEIERFRALPQALSKTEADHG